MIAGRSFPGIYKLSALVDAVEDTARRFGARFDRGRISPTLDAFQDAFEGGCTGYRTTTKTEKSVNFRYFNLTVPHDAYEVANRAGLLPSTRHPGERIIPHVLENFPMDGDSSGFGVDVGADYGLEKIWVFFQDSPPLGRILEIPGLPGSVKGNLDYFRKNGLERVKLIGVDFRSRTMNIYFLPWETAGLSDGWAGRLVSGIGCETPGADVLRHCGRALSMYYTFAWDSPDVERLCFACVAPAPEAVPAWHTVIRKFVDTAKSAAGHRIFYYNPTFARPDGYFVKIEICFHERYAEELTRLVPKSYLERLQHD